MKTVSNLLLAVSLLTPTLVWGQAKSPAVTKSAPAAPAATAPSAPAAVAPTAKEITDAKAKGLVWVDTKAGVYFMRGKSFGKTAEGKFMSVADAKAAGYHSAKQAVAKH